MEQERKINTVIECKGVSKIFDTPEGKHEVVRGLNFAAEKMNFWFFLDQVSAEKQPLSI